MQSALNLNGVTITGTGFYVPTSLLTNLELAASLDTSDEWISQRTGIRQRYIAEASTDTSDLAVVAATQALSRAQLSPEDVDLIVVATSTPDYAFPSTAMLVKQKLGSRAPAFDLSAACSGFVYALSVSSDMMKSGAYHNVLVIGADKFSKIIDWQDRNTAVLFGDGAGAVVLQSRPGAFPCFSLLGSEEGGVEALTSPVTGPITMQGREVFKFGVRIVESMLTKALETLKLSIDDIALIIPHQANIRIIESAAGKMNIPLDKFFVNIENYGNTSAASIPIALAEAMEQQRVHAGDIVMLVGFGAGLAWGVQVIQIA
ncbi:beta-ketoacyl-ACP synthase III [Paenibacillus terrae]|uniref:Beta-ketoacyl-[acyl-carrier-protein] synthase III n=1 Tax=Paenibacillus terrae TaxID=159743 RepID=A0A0D7X259_9BACL|nr:beta-ketoacyl-ACP synthase III [Paenibacillus terrae]KJD45500.1 3-oxoacyl-ACP synthase [Paenibacillus terrae]